MYSTFAVVQVVISALLITVILLQEGKKGMGAIFGGSSASVFGAKGAGNVLTKATTVLAVLFLFNSIWLGHLSSSDESVVNTVSSQITTDVEKNVTAKPVEKATETKKADKPEK